MYIDAAIDAARTLIERWADPVLFAYEALGIDRLWPRQEELLRAVAAHERVAVKSGQKTSKTHSECILSIHHALTHPGSQVVVLAPSQHHLDTVFWRELTKLRAATYDRRETNADGTPRRRALLPLGGDFHVSPAAGWRFPNGSVITGFVTNDPERLRGVSGPDNLYVIDEATAVSDDIYASVDGNLAGGGKVLAISNPVHTRGWFYRCFADGSPWHTLTISSIEASEVSPPIPGLATAKFIAEKRTEWGEDSPEWFAKVLGAFPPAESEERSVIQRAAIDDALGRWTPEPPDPRAPLVIGVDPAHEGKDKTAIIWRRGNWTSTPIVLEGCDTKIVTRRIVDLIHEVARQDERATVHIDGSSVGAGVRDNLKHDHADICSVVNLMAAESSPDKRCERLRDALWIHLREQMPKIAISPEDGVLADDLVTPRLGLHPSTLRYKVEAKRDMKKRIGRSTDRADALALVVWSPRSAVPSFTSWGSTRG